MALEKDIDHFSKLKDDGVQRDHYQIGRHQSEYFHRVVTFLMVNLETSIGSA